MFDWIKKIIKQEKYVKSKSLRRKANQELDDKKAEKLFRKADRLNFQSKQHK